MYVLSRSVMSDSAASLTVPCQTPLSMGLSRQDYWSRLPFPTPGDLPDPGIETVSLTSPALAGRFFITMPPGKLHFILSPSLYIFLSPYSDAVSQVLISLACFNSRFKQMKPIHRRPKHHGKSCLESLHQTQSSFRGCSMGRNRQIL